MSFGIGIFAAHLDVLDPAARDPAELDWPGILSWVTASKWNGGTGPEFALRTFVNGNYQCAVGEPSAAQSQAPTLKRIAPVVSTDPVRQREPGDNGFTFGASDAMTLCNRLANRISSGEFGVPNGVINIYLDVPSGSALSPDYWAGWSDAVYTYELVDRVRGTDISQPFVPCICAAFEQNAAKTMWSVSKSVKDCLDVVALAYPNHHVRCFAFWVKATDPLRRGDPNSPPLDWSLLSVYLMTVSAYGSLPVSNTGWRYIEQAGTPDMTFAAGMPVTIEASKGEDNAFNFMLTINNTWAVALPTATDWGFDASVDTSSQRDCLITAIIDGTQANPPIPIDPTVSGVAFIARYYDAGLIGGHRLTHDESVFLRSIGLGRVAVWESPRRDPAGHRLFPADRWRTLTTLIAAGANVDHLNTSPLQDALLAGDTVVVTASPHSITAEAFTVAAGGAPAKATQIPVVPQKAAVAHPVNHLIKVQSGSDYFAQPFGYLDGHDAFAFAADMIGQLAYTPVFFAVDFDADAPDVANLVTYFGDVARAHADYLVFQKANGLDATPFAIGIYGPAFALALCYRQGICSHFWQAFGPSNSHGRNVNPWIHANISQRGIDTTDMPMYVCTLHADIDAAWGDIGAW